ncbi:ABC transporter ATP-binding protein [Tengunoibacter tsumagoiensis]|uniref:ABC transporter ATP-binding protein n=1 Tax=Tengunoibacter tsumagoiensis TaxID=2014871 RepID=A0A401ZWN8_9CHLR|nr:ABC transporter ATP-binding protein [Tengunoibacter tsumagoiensis]GCE11329.1 ABC transporter ATP-binding protein [Tengunoibacter tsumagoiensis]
MSEIHESPQERIEREAEKPMVVIEHLGKQFGKLRVVDDLTMTIREGETFGLIGPNGSGKTTLIRMLVGLTRPDSGSITIMGLRQSDARIAATMGYMTQSSALYTDLTAQENMQFFCDIYGLRGREQRLRIHEMLERVDLADRAASIVGTFSGGMKQRLSLACALVHKPRLVLLDEPTVGVDPELRRSFWDYFAQLNQEGVTIIVSTHHLDEAARCTRLGLLRFGRLLAQDEPETLLRLSGKATMEDAFLYFASRQQEVQA